MTRTLDHRFLRGSTLSPGLGSSSAVIVCTWPRQSTGMDSWEAERGMNKLHLDTPTPAGEPTWRVEVLGWGLQLGRRLVPQATALTALPVQAVVALQSAIGDVDPEIDVATGSLHIYVIRSAKHDLSRTIETSAQPCLTRTASSGG
jgi:hypothetical protein